MKKLLYRLNYVDCFKVEKEEPTYLMLGSASERVFNTRFVVGIICFVTSMILKANFNEPVAAIPLSVSTLILLSGVWKLSAVGQVVFDKAESKVFCIYKHLGYLQKIYVHSLRAIDAVELSGTTLSIRLDNDRQVIISKSKNMDEAQLQETKERLVAFLNLKAA